MALVAIQTSRIDPNGGGNMVDCVEFEELNLADVAV